MQAIKWLLKVVMAGIVSVMIISGLLFFYYIIPVHEENKRGNTDYVWPANSIWIKATEGIAFGKYDENGFNNLVKVDNPDIIVLGSSHMEATNVMQNENAPYILSEKLNGKYSLYNMGISGHNFFKVCQYLPANLELYDKIPKVAVIETSTVRVSQEKADEVISSSVEHTPSHNTGIIALLQRIPFFRAAYHQFEEGLLNLFMPAASPSENMNEDSEIIEDAKETKKEIDADAYKEIFSYLRNMEDKYGTQIIIVYHPTEELLEDGTIFFDKNEQLKTFGTYADKYDISFIDMSDRFAKMYYEDNHVAHGFCTGKLAAGHLNKYGHAAIADELYKEIIRLEEAKELCQ